MLDLDFLGSGGSLIACRLELDTAGFFLDVYVSLEK